MACQKLSSPLVTNLRIVEASRKIIRIGILYAAFAFISSLIREAIKDIEDMQGDERYGCRTMPIVWGVNAQKFMLRFGLLLFLLYLIILQVYVSRFGWWWAMAYSIVFIIVPFVLIFLQLFKAKDQKDYHRLSNWTKLGNAFRNFINDIFLFLPMNKIILASQSPRRKQLLEWAEIPFEIIVKETSEDYPPGLEPEEIAVYIAQQKAARSTKTGFP